MTQPSSRLNPHRSLVALDGEGSTSTGVASLRGRNGESLHVRVVQSQEREDLNMLRVGDVILSINDTPVYEHGGAIRSVDVATGSFDVVFIPVDDAPSERQLHPMEA